MTLLWLRDTGPPETERFFRFSGAKTSKSLKKSRAARAMKLTSDHENQDFATATAKNEDPAKMAHSTPDFLSRHGAKR
jgi:hypothetical protein